MFTSAALGGSRYTWFRKEILIPHEWINQRIFIYLGGARYEPHVFINNKFIAKQSDGWIPFEADLDPGGVADVIGLHYPHEMPENADYPNTAHWLDDSVVTGTGGGLMGSRGKLLCRIIRGTCLRFIRREKSRRNLTV
ncbi:MAG: hypothetical protein JXJ04_09375 [Spirochaetales bacterium]|nr:hypothetical protein [Spirochaetales bacterium]